MYLKNKDDILNYKTYSYPIVYPRLGFKEAIVLLKMNDINVKSDYIIKCQKITSVVTGKKIPFKNVTFKFASHQMYENARTILDLNS